MALVKLLPVFKDYSWDGTKLKENYNKKASLDIVAENWELPTHKDGRNIVDSGKYKGLTLSEYVEKLGRDTLGTKRNVFEFFPIPIELIDVEGDLFIQVHPDNECTPHAEKEHGETGTWYIPDVEEGAGLYYGTDKGITKDKFRARIEDNTILDVLKKAPVHKGDVFFTESGTTHAVGEGIAIYEIQQNSNMTYRVYNFGRVGKDGGPRELYIEKVIDVSNLTPLESDFKPIDEEKDYGTYKYAMMATREYFTTHVHDMKAEYSMKVDEESFASSVIVDGGGSIEGDGTVLSIRKGDSIFTSADTGKATTKGSCRFILSRV